MRQTETWFEIFRDLSIDECLETIKNFPTSCHKRNHKRNSYTRYRFYPFYGNHWI